MRCCNNPNHNPTLTTVTDHASVVAVVQIRPVAAVGASVVLQTVLAVLLGAVAVPLETVVVVVASVYPTAEGASVDRPSVPSVVADPMTSVGELKKTFILPSSCKC